jgi:hypothetical protein
MTIQMIKNFSFKGIEFKADTTYTLDETFAKYLIRKNVAVEV